VAFFGATPLEMRGHQLIEAINRDGVAMHLQRLLALRSDLMGYLKYFVAIRKRMTAKTDGFCRSSEWAISFFLWGKILLPGIAGLSAITAFGGGCCRSDPGVFCADSSCHHGGAHASRNYC